MSENELASVPPTIFEYMGISFGEVRQRRNQGEAAVSALVEFLSTYESLTGSIATLSNRAKQSQVLQTLAQLPIDNLKEASESSIRIETLRKFGFTNVASVYNSSLKQLEKIPGISLESAEQIKTLADQIYLAAASATLNKFDIEDLDDDEVRLLDKIQRVEVLQSTLKQPVEKLRPLVGQLTDSLIASAKANSRIGWLFTPSRKKEIVLEAIEQMTLILGDPVSMLVVEGARKGIHALEQEKPDPIADYSSRAGAYYAILEKVTNIKPLYAAHRHISDELISSIEAQELDTATLKATLRGYQTFGGKFALTQKRVIIGDEMGLGKTLQAISVLIHRQKEGARHFLVVCPASVLTNWEREIRSKSELAVIAMHGSDSNQELRHWINQGGVGLTTFDTIKTFLLSDEEITQIALDTVVVDEAHYIKNSMTGRTKTITRWLERSPYALFLTGTPLENRVEEFSALATLLDKNIGGNLWRLALAAGPQSFRQAAAPIYLRRNVSEVLSELPELIQTSEFCSWEGVDRQQYLDAVTSGNFMAMRRAAFAPLNNEIPGKLARLTELVDEAFENNYKVIIFSFFRSVINQVINHLGEKAIGPITGEVPASQRQQLVDAFQNDPQPRALVGQIQALGTGLNIQAASVVILCEPQIKPSLEVQAIARAHRMGQTRRVQVHRLILPESVDERMLDLLAHKQEEFEKYARISALADTAGLGSEPDEEIVAGQVLQLERDRLGISSANPKVVLKPEEE